MKLNNKSFLLYDAIVALTILSGFIYFFLNFIYIIQEQKYYYDIEYKAISYYRESLFNYDVNNSFLTIEEKKIYSKETKGDYCVFYEAYKEEKSICYKK